MEKSEEHLNSRSQSILDSLETVAKTCECVLFEGITEGMEHGCELCDPGQGSAGSEVPFCISDARLGQRLVLRVTCTDWGGGALCGKALSPGAFGPH